MTNSNDGTLLGRTREGLEELARRLIDEGVEAKADLKSTFAVDTAHRKIEFCKDLSAIANTDDHRLDDHGYIIIGAKRGTLIGGVDTWKDVGEDNFSATLTNIAKKYLAPVPAFNFVSYQDDDVGHWGVIVIPPSPSQPHIFIKEVSGDPAKHEWFVRINDITERAGPSDYARVLSKAASRAVKPLETELQRLVLKVERLEGQAPNLDGLAALLGQGTPATETRATDQDDDDGPSPRSDSLVARLRRHLVTEEARVADLLIEEALNVKALMLDDRAENPHRFPSWEPSELIKHIEYMETEARTLVEAIATVARYGSNERFGDAVVEAVDVIAERPKLAGPYWNHAPELRTYPLTLALYALAFVSAGRNDGALLRRVLDLDYRLDQEGDPVPIIAAMRDVRMTSDLFRTAMGKRYYEPIAERVKTVIPVWCGRFVPGKPGDQPFYQGEFGLALEYTKFRLSFHGAGFPLPGTYLYGYEAEAAIKRMLKQKAKFLSDLHGEQVENRLKQFDTNAHEMIAPGASGFGGFYRGASAAWSGDGDDP